MNMMKISADVPLLGYIQNPGRRVTPHLGELLLRGEAQAEDGVGSAVGPLAKLLGRLCESHVWRNGAVNNNLARQNNR